MSAHPDSRVIEIHGGASPHELAAVLAVLCGGAQPVDVAGRGPIADWRERRRAALAASLRGKTRSAKDS